MPRKLHIIHYNCSKHVTLKWFTSLKKDKYSVWKCNYESSNMNCGFRGLAQVQLFSVAPEVKNDKKNKKSI